MDLRDNAIGVLVVPEIREQIHNSNNVTHCNRIALLFNEPNNIFLPHGICLIAKKLSR